ncbi:hypothetical protein LB557_02035 [Mesorhizobium sp. BR115XR7A]|uniref:hypothetical protein n=1 Tax=Mesorhizobium sp. BR115XR7A TaxID=2876645 RepID=UPI001CCE784C|nr:hypothetical protein [Mesorhizobium sp. BR115XR7A]MBZ9904787.1 hypothetical protein [Mesorhizobium sp. BR115XR7A]MBZ9933030.1 hypothetical protein [Mesorhizobium sp. BR1-1-5]
MSKATLTIPPLTIDAEYKDFDDRELALNSSIRCIRAEKAEVESAIAAERVTEGPRLRSSVATLVGDEDTAVVDRRKKLQELRHAEHDHDEALVVVQRRKHARISHASRVVIAAVQGEIDKRVAAVVAGTEAALTAQADLESLIRDLEAEGVEADSLRSGVVPFFLTSGQAARYVAEHGSKNG